MWEEKSLPVKCFETFSIHPIEFLEYEGECSDATKHFQSAFVAQAQS